MGQALFSGKPTGTVGLGLFIIALSAFALSIPATPHFGLGVAGGVLAARFLARRRLPMPHIDPRQLDVPEGERR